jgi:hypothetical protein
MWEMFPANRSQAKSWILLVWRDLKESLSGPRRWRQCVSPKRLYLPTSLHGVTTQSNNVVTAMRTSNLTQKILYGTDVDIHTSEEVFSHKKKLKTDSFFEVFLST